MCSNSKAPKADFRGISKFVTVHGGGPGGICNVDKPAAEAEYYINQMYRVTDHHGFDLAVEARTDGGRTVVARGINPVGDYQDKNRLRTISNAEKTDNGRPRGLPARELTDYEAGRRHIAADCRIFNCDHPVHFGGDEFGKVVFESLDDKTKGQEGDAE